MGFPVREQGELGKDKAKSLAMSRSVRRELCEGLTQCLRFFLRGCFSRWARHAKVRRSWG